MRRLHRERLRRVRNIVKAMGNRTPDTFAHHKDTPWGLLITDPWTLEDAVRQGVARLPFGAGSKTRVFYSAVHEAKLTRDRFPEEDLHVIAEAAVHIALRVVGKRATASEPAPAYLVNGVPHSWTRSETRFLDGDLIPAPQYETAYRPPQAQALVQPDDALVLQAVDDRAITTAEPFVDLDFQPLRENDSTRAPVMLFSTLGSLLSRHLDKGAGGKGLQPHIALVGHGHSADAQLLSTAFPSGVVVNVTPSAGDFRTLYLRDNKPDLVVLHLPERRQADYLRLLQDEDALWSEVEAVQGPDAHRSPMSPKEIRASCDKAIDLLTNEAVLVIVAPKHGETHSLVVDYLRERGVIVPFHPHGLDSEQGAVVVPATSTRSLYGVPAPSGRMFSVWKYRVGRQLGPYTDEQRLALGRAAVVGDPLSKEGVTHRGNPTTVDSVGLSKAAVHDAVLDPNSHQETLDALLTASRRGRRPPSRRTLVKKKSGGMRKIDAPSNSGRVNAYLMHRDLQGLVDRHRPFPSGVIGFQPIRDVEALVKQSTRTRPTIQDQAAAQAQKVLRLHGPWAVVLDLRDAFGLLPHQLTQEAMKDLTLNHGDRRALLEQVRIKTLLASGKLVRSKGRGIEQGNPLSPLVLNICLAFLFRTMGIDSFFSYGDDLLIPVPNEEEGKQVFHHFQQVASSFGMQGIRPLASADDDNPKASRVINTTETPAKIIRTYLVSPTEIGLVPEKLDALRRALANRRVVSPPVVRRLARAQALSKSWMKKKGLLRPSKTHDIFPLGSPSGDSPGTGPQDPSLEGEAQEGATLFSQAPRNPRPS